MSNVEPAVTGPKNQGTKTIIALAAVVVVLAGVRAISDAVINPLLLALFITIIISPYLSWAQKRGISPATSILVILSTLIVASLFAVALLGTSLQQFSQQLPEYTSMLSNKEQLLMSWLEDHGLSSKATGREHLFDANAVGKLFAQLINSLIGILGKSVIILVLVGFMLAEIAWLPGKIKAASTNSSDAMERVGLVAENIRRYIAIKTVVSLLTGLIVATGTYLFGVPFPAVWGFLAFLLNYIPNIGSIIASVPAILVAFLSPQGLQLGFTTIEMGGVTTALLTSGLYVFVNQLFGSFVEPRWQGRGLGLSPLVVFVSLLFWGWILGPIGMLLSAPLTMAVKIALEGYDDTRWLAVLLSGNPKRALTTDSSA